MTEPIKLVPGELAYTDHEGNTQKVWFQFNPSTLKRARTAAFQETESNDRQGTSVERGSAGQKYTITVERWKIDFDIRLDSSVPMWDAYDKRAASPSMQSLVDNIKHLEALIEPGPVPSENDETYGYQRLPDPPAVKFTWGSRCWAGFVTSLSISETEFTPDLVPKRVEAAISMVIIDTLRQLELGRTGGGC